MIFSTILTSKQVEVVNRLIRSGGGCGLCGLSTLIAIDVELDEGGTTATITLLLASINSERHWTIQDLFQIRGIDLENLLWSTMI